MPEGGTNDCWCDGGDYDRTYSGRSNIVTDMGLALSDGAWSGSKTFEVRAHLELGECEFNFQGSSICAAYDGGPSLPEVPGHVDVTYRGVMKSLSRDFLQAGYSSDCSNLPVGPTGAWITVYETALADNTYFEITAYDPNESPL